MKAKEMKKNKSLPDNQKLIVPINNDIVPSERLEFDNWNVDYFLEATPLIKYLNSQKQFIGNKISKIMTMGCIFNYDSIIDGHDRYLDLDEPVVIVIDNYNLEIWFYCESRVKIGINSLTLTERLYQDYPWHDCSNLFKRDVIGQKITGFNVKRTSDGFYDSLGLGDRENGGDYFESFSILLENANLWIFQVTLSIWEFLSARQLKCYKRGFPSRQRQLGKNLGKIIIATALSRICYEKIILG